MPDVFTKAKRSDVMSRIRSRGNKATELKLVSILRAAGISGWRRHQPVPGRPDFIFRRARLALFVDGCFWHGCRWHCRMPKSRKEFWTSKIARNRARDREVRAQLRSRGWKLLRVWEHALADPAEVLRRLKAALASPGIPR
jgi:DNA mismatch endonuclease (patch repair protein)